VTPSGTLSYQWYSNTTNSNTGGTPISGATSNSFAIPARLTVGTYYYYCVVNAIDAVSVASNVAIVTVKESSGCNATSYGYLGFALLGAVLSVFRMKK
jgi:hypothetical protein